MFILAPQELLHYSSLWNKTFTTGKVSASFNLRSGGPSSLFQKRKKKMKKTVFAACIRQFSRVDTIGFVFNKMADQLI